jgi:hypothetical protein
VCVIRILSNKSISELPKAKSMVMIPVVSSEEQVNLICFGENTDSSETLSQISLCNTSVSAMVKYYKCVMQVEIRLHCERSFTVLKFALLCDQVTESIYECVLFLSVEDGLAGRAAAGLDATCDAQGTAPDGAAPDGTSMRSDRRMVSHRTMMMHWGVMSDRTMGVSHGAVMDGRALHGRVVKHWAVMSDRTMGVSHGAVVNHGAVVKHWAVMSHGAVVNHRGVVSHRAVMMHWGMVSHRAVMMHWGMVSHRAVMMHWAVMSHR